MNSVLFLMLFPGFSSSLAVGISTKNMSVWGSFCIFTTSILASLLGVEINILHHLGNFQARLLCLFPASRLVRRRSLCPAARRCPEAHPLPCSACAIPLARRPPALPVCPRTAGGFFASVIYFLLIGSFYVLASGLCWRPPQLPPQAPPAREPLKAAPRLCLQVQPGSRQRVRAASPPARLRRVCFCACPTGLLASGRCRM